MIRKTFEVEIENGNIRTLAAEALPAKARGLLTLLDDEAPGPAATCVELADRWQALPKLPPDEAESFANDLDRARVELPPPRASWD